MFFSLFIWFCTNEGMNEQVISFFLSAWAAFASAKQTPSLAVCFYFLFFSAVDWTRGCGDGKIKRGGEGREGGRGKDWMRVWKRGGKGEMRKKLLKRVKPLNIRYGCLKYCSGDGERTGEEAGWKGQNKQGRPQTRLTELIDGEELEGDVERLLKECSQ